MKTDNNLVTKVMHSYFLLQKFLDLHCIDSINANFTLIDKSYICLIILSLFEINFFIYLLLIRNIGLSYVETEILYPKDHIYIYIYIYIDREIDR